MQYDKLGNTDIEVSKICLGTMTFGEQNTEVEGHAQLNYALENGVNFIDTAEMYSVPGKAETQGSTERIIGTWLKDRSDRDKIVLATKVTGPTPMNWIRDGKGYDKSVFQKSVDDSLQRLQTDYIDLYQLHWPMRKMNMFSVRGVTDIDHKWEDDFQSILEGLDEVIQSGKIRHIGISNENPWGMSRYLHLSEMHDLPRMMSIQNPYSLLCRTFEVGLSEMAIRENCGLLAYSPMAFGLLSGKFHKKTDTPNDRWHLFPQMQRYRSQNSWDATAKYLEIAENNGMTLAEMSLAWVNSRPFVTSNIIGATNLDQLKENIGSINFELSDDVLNAIEEVHNVIPNPAP